MATTLRFRTPHIEELPAPQSKQAPGYRLEVVTGPQEDPSKNWGTTNRKRQRTSLGQTEQQREAVSARQQRDIERRIRDLNSDHSRDVPIEVKKQATGPGATKHGKTTNTKKILASGKTFAHYLDDEEAEIARTGKRDGDAEPVASTIQRASKTPIARRKIREESSPSSSPAPSAIPSRPPDGPDSSAAASTAAPPQPGRTFSDDHDEDEDDDSLPAVPSQAEIEALLDAPALTYNQARSAPPPLNAPPVRRFCDTCGYWGRVKCMKCGVMTCSVACKDDHDQFRCLKMYA